MSHFDGFSARMWRGDTFRFKFVVKIFDDDTEQDVIQNITNWEKFWFTAKRSVKDLDADAIIALDDGSVGGIVRTDPTNGEGLVTITPAMTEDLPSRKKDLELLCDLQGIDGSGDTWTLLSGILEVHSDITVRTT